MLVDSSCDISQGYGGLGAMLATTTTYEYVCIHAEEEEDGIFLLGWHKHIHPCSFYLWWSSPREKKS